jgi:hypothetical protein
VRENRERPLHRCSNPFVLLLTDPADARALGRRSCMAIPGAVENSESGQRMLDVFDALLGIPCPP